MAEASVANPGQPLTLIATIANTGDSPLTSPALTPVAGRCFSGDVLMTVLYELVGDGDSSFEPGEIRARICRGYAPSLVGSYVDGFQATANGSGGPLSEIASSNLEVVTSPATPTPPVGGWPAPPPYPPAPVTTPGQSIDVRAFGPASVVAGDAVTLLGTIANTGTTNLYVLEFASTSGPCADTTLTERSQFFEIHGDGDGLSVLEPGEMFAATCSGFAQVSYSQPAGLRGRVAPLGGATLEDSDTLAVAVLPNPAADMTAVLQGPATIAPGAPLTLTAVVENTGSIPLTLTSVVPDVPCPGTVTGPVENPGDGDGSFEPGEQVEVSCTFTPDGSVDPIQAGVTASASIAPGDGGGSLTREADITVDVLVDSRIEIVTLDPPKIGPAGQPVTATAELTNPGNTALTVQSIVTTPTQCPPAPRQVIAGDLDLLLEPGEVWHFECTVNAPTTSDPITATSTVHALDPALSPVQDSFSFLFDPLTDGTGGTSVDLLPEQPVAGGATVGTNIDTSPDDPIGTEVTSPYGTTISIVETTVLTTEPTSAGFLGWQVDIHLDPDTPGSSAENPLPDPSNPLRVVFYIDQSIFGNGGQIYRDGEPIPMPGNCPEAGVADPEPCIESRVLTAGGDLKITVLALHASSWNFVANDGSPEPGVTITTPPDGASYLLGQAVDADFECTGELLLGGCVGTVPDGTPIATGAAALGANDFSVTASVPGGSGTLTNSYSVLFGFAGFDAPVDNRPVVNVAKAGSAIPVKFRLTDSAGASVYPQVGLDVLDGAPTSAKVACDSDDQSDAIEETVSQSGPELTYDASSGQYKFVWKTAKSWSTVSGGGPCRRLTVALRDGTKRSAEFRFK